MIFYNSYSSESDNDDNTSKVPSPSHESYYSTDSKSRDNSFKSQNYMENVAQNKLKKFELENRRLSQSLVLLEMKVLRLSCNLYKMNYVACMEELKARDWMKDGIIHRKLIQALQQI